MEIKKLKLNKDSNYIDPFILNSGSIVASEYYESIKEKK